MPDSDQLAETFFNPEREGWLTKEGGKVKSKRKRWFILKEGVLYYFKKETARVSCLQCRHSIQVTTKQQRHTSHTYSPIFLLTHVHSHFLLHSTDYLSPSRQLYSHNSPSPHNPLTPPLLPSHPSHTLSLHLSSLHTSHTPSQSTSPPFTPLTHPLTPPPSCMVQDDELIGSIPLDNLKVRPMPDRHPVSVRETLQ